jgi:hypothetical protein
MKQLYFHPNIERVGLDHEISLQLTSIEDSNPYGEPNWMMSAPPTDAPNDPFVDLTGY